MRCRAGCHAHTPQTRSAHARAPAHQRHGVLQLGEGEAGVSVLDAAALLLPCLAQRGLQPLNVGGLHAQAARKQGRGAAPLQFGATRSRREVVHKRVSTRPHRVCVGQQRQVLRWEGVWAVHGAERRQRLQHRRQALAVAAAGAAAVRSLAAAGGSGSVQRKLNGRLLQAAHTVAAVGPRAGQACGNSSKAQRVQSRVRALGPAHTSCCRPGLMT